MPNQRSVIIGVFLGIAAIIALCLFVISTLNPIKWETPKINFLNFPPAVFKTSPAASSSSQDWQLPQASTSAEPLFLVIINPSNNLVTQSSQTRVSGQTSTQAKITINEKPLTTNSDGSFSAITELTPSENEFVITAYDSLGNENIQTALVLAAPTTEGSQLQISSLTGIVNKITGNNYQIVTDKGVVTEFEVNPLTRYLRKYGAASTKEEIVEGSEVEVVGVGTEALLIRNLSLTVHTGYLSGTIHINSGISKLTTTTGVDFTFAPGVASSTAYKDGQPLYLLGLFDPHSQVVSSILESSIVWK